MRAISRWAVSSATALVLAVTSFATMAADEISWDALLNKIQAAKTAGDHEEIAAIYDKLAASDEASAEMHRRTASIYRVTDPSGRTYGQMAVHCKSLADRYAHAAKEHSDLAELHRKAAAESR